MSYFQQEDLEKIKQSSSGFTSKNSITRQSFFVTGASLIALLATSCQRRSQSSTKLKKKISYSESLALMEKQAKEQVQNFKDEEAYIAEMKALIADINQFPRKEFNPKRKIDMAEYSRLPLVVMIISMQANAFMPLHDHQDYNGVLLGLEGECQCRNFEYQNGVPKRSKEKSFLIRETENIVLKKGEMSHLTLTSNYLHSLKAGPEGALLFDVFTFITSVQAHAG